MARLNEAPTFLPTSFFLLPRCDCCVPGLAMDSGWASDTSSFDLPWPAQPVNIGHRRGASSSSARTSSSVPLSAATQPIPTPRTHVTTACERCRKLKARCDGDGPPCGRCATLRIPTVGRFQEHSLAGNLPCITRPTAMQVPRFARQKNTRQPYLHQ